MNIRLQKVKKYEQITEKRMGLRRPLRRDAVLRQLQINIHN